MTNWWGCLPFVPLLQKALGRGERAEWSYTFVLWLTVLDLLTVLLVSAAVLRVVQA